MCNLKDTYMDCVFKPLDYSKREDAVMPNDGRAESARAAFREAERIKFTNSVEVGGFALMSVYGENDSRWIRTSRVQTVSFDDEKQTMKVETRNSVYEFIVAE